MYNLMYRIKNDFTFNRREIKELIISIVLMTFIVGWDDGSETFQIVGWLWGLLNSFVIVSLAVLLHVTAKKVAGLWRGYKVEFKAWKFDMKIFGTTIGFYGLLFGFLFLYFSSNNIWFLLGGGFLAIAVDKYRTGHELFGINKKDYSLIAFFGVFSNLVLMLLLRSLYFMNNGLIEKAIMVNASLVLFSLLPLPSSDGLKLLFQSAPAYVSFLVGTLVVVFLSSSDTGISEIGTLNTLVLAFLLGFLVWIMGRRYMKGL